MALLASCQYDPAAAVTKATITTPAVQVAMDTTNLRNVFTVPPNGRVLMRQRICFHGSATFPTVLLSALEGSTIRGRAAPLGSLTATALSTTRVPLENLIVVPGLTAGSSLTWDMAWGFETISGAGGLKYGGPDNTTTDDAFGAAIFEIYDAPNCLGAVAYDPGSAVAKSCATRIAMTAFDTTNARITFVAQTTRVLWRVRCNLSGATTFPQVLLGVMDGATVMGRACPITGIPATALATTNVPMEASGVITGLTRGTTYNYDAAYGVEVLLAATNINYGGPNDTTANNAWGALQFEIWAI
jgi:hypothetical protein